MAHAARRIVSIVLGCTMFCAGCATVDKNGQPLSALDRSINQCVGSLVVGTVLGALIGAASRRGNAGKGAMYGAGAGAVMCAVFVAMNDAQDKERVRQSQMNAALSGQTQTYNYVGDDGRARSIETTSEPAAIPVSTTATTGADDSPAITGPCRKTHTTITVQNTGSAVVGEMICRNAVGDYVRVNTGKEI